MVITVQGFNCKRNKATMAASIIALATSTIKGQKTLIIELIDDDIETVERALKGTGLSARIAAEDDTLVEAGIDALLREVDSIRLSKPEFDQYCSHVLQQDNRLDIATVTKQANFTENLKHRLTSLATLIENAKEVYDTIILLCPTGDKELTRALNSLESTKTETKEVKGKKVEYNPCLIDRSVYCIRQGFDKRAKAYGNNIVYLVTEFEEGSYFTLANLKKQYCEKGNLICHIPHSIKVTDAAQLGQLTGYIITNREVDPLDINYPFIHAMHSVVNTITGLKGYDVDYEWEDIKKEVKVLDKVTELPPKPIDEPIEKPKKGLFGGLFKKKKKKTSEPLNKPVNFDSIEEENSVVAEILAASDKKRKQDVNAYSEEDEEPIALPKLNLLDDSDLDDLVPVETPQKKAPTKQAAKATKTTKKNVAESKKAEPKTSTKKTVKDVKTTATKQTTKSATKTSAKTAAKETKTAAKETVTRPVPKSKVNRLYSDGRIMVEGNMYPSITAAAKRYGKVPSTASRNLKAGKKIKEVFGL